MFKYEEWFPKIQHNYKINALFWWIGAIIGLIGLVTDGALALTGFIFLLFFTIQDYIDGQNNKE